MDAGSILRSSMKMATIYLRASIILCFVAADSSSLGLVVDIPNEEWQVEPFILKAAAPVKAVVRTTSLRLNIRLIVAVSWCIKYDLPRPAPADTVIRSGLYSFDPVIHLFIVSITVAAMCLCSSFVSKMSYSVPSDFFGI
jgi:hypothetical protein